MFEQLLRRIEDRARQRAEARAFGMVERLRETLPRGIVVEAADDGVRLSGRGLLRRFLVDPALRWLVLQCARDEGRRWR